MVQSIPPVAWGDCGGGGGVDVLGFFVRGRPRLPNLSINTTTEKIARQTLNMLNKLVCVAVFTFFLRGYTGRCGAERMIGGGWRRLHGVSRTILAAVFRGVRR